MRFCFITTDSCQIRDDEDVENRTLSFHPTSALYVEWKAKYILFNNEMVLHRVILISRFASMHY